MTDQHSRSHKEPLSVTAALSSTSAVLPTIVDDEDAYVPADEERGVYLQPIPCSSNTEPAYSGYMRMDSFRGEDHYSSMTEYEGSTTNAGQQKKEKSIVNPAKE